MRSTFISNKTDERGGATGIVTLIQSDELSDMRTHITHGNVKSRCLEDCKWLCIKHIHVLVLMLTLYDL